ncbi:hypothetical protein [Fodinibius salsisoli]|uniref:Secreted protein n=1 Tax=Fodinibius salsisoli TaxID=2820877 RepID=A0ABT3PLK8_9BACT|nr:hypothetical protein [Fodinibius salsisoli]MCW9706799.1 hypothetical protein [Fodinibius salsisoli]
MKRIYCAVLLVITITTLGKAQQTHSSGQQTIFDRLQSNLRVELSGSVITATHGMQLTFPAFWIGHQVKVEPLIGFFWDDFSAPAPETGIRMIYYFKSQPLNGGVENSLYAGLSGMSTKFTHFGREVTDVAVGGLVLGHSFGLSSSIELSPEILLGFDESSEFEPEAGVSLVIHF